MATAKGDWLRLKLLELARQVSFDIAISFDELGPLRMVCEKSKKPWRLRHGHGDEHHRNLYYALALIEKLKELLGCTPEDEWQIFELVSIDKSIERFHSRTEFQQISMFPLTKIGSYFLTILSLLRVAHRHFRHYTLHPYANYFSTQECIDIISCYYEHLVFDDDITASIRMELEISEQPLIGMVEQATSLANKINERARVLLKDLLRKDLNVKVSNFEKNAAKHIAGLWDFLEDVTCDDKNLKVVIKARFEFERYSDNKKNHNGIRAHADRFSRAITDFNTDLRKTTALKGFVNMVSSIHAPETMPWYQETFITLCFPKNEYPFDYHKESFSLLCKYDKKISKSIRIFTNNPRSTKYSELAKRLNIDTQQGSNLVDFIKVLKSQKKDDKCHMTTVSIVDYLHQKMAMFDSLIFLNEAQARWHKCAKKYCSDDVSATQSGGYAMTLFSALLIENKTIIPLIAPPDILIKQSGSLNSIAHTDKKHLMMIKNTLQMLPLPKLETMPDGLQKEMAVGIPSNSHMLLDIIKSSMAKMFFMKLTLKGLNCKINEVRDTSSHSVNKNSRMPKRKSHSSSRTELKKIIMRFSMWN
ncbi:hypothetical protein ACUIHB_01830 [Aeromonas veronii]|uniref:hypothetical protein n=1 Tax=Aeromonas veronii TaxID=654 RepID=UPI00191EC131|nr:hypothetical protein [Aeromonas veronii]MBL0451603.1 hypothetical protein [Aeromonas veronii]